jgi:DNA helicase-2/ATP-dependent DNA helicase PcrA
LPDDPSDRIAACDDTPLRVVAGPGTGKTRALTRLIKRRLAEGAAPERMFACTFSRTAAADLAKAVKALGVKGAGIVRATTLHAFCFGVLGNQKVMSQTGRVARPLLAHSDGQTHCVQWQNMSQEAAGIAEFVKSRINLGRVEAGNPL